jgi:fructuronate reductase
VTALSFSTLEALPPAVARPAYDPRALGIGIVHLGLGAFHRAHQALYTDDVLARGGADWGIAGVSLRSTDLRDRLRAQDCLYVAVEKGPRGTRHRVVGSVREALSLAVDGAEVRARLVDPRTRIVSLTVTEKGYCHNPATGRLDRQHPEIVRDLAAPQAPVSTIGLLAWALDARRLSHGAPVTVLCCDNLPHNGATVRRILLDFAELREPRLARWIETHVAFPSTMVDRIVPATTPADVDAVRAACGCSDAAPVVYEPFRQWVIEDAFATERPAWELAGAQFVDDVAPFETMKLRLLNGSHSAFAYLGYLAGHDFIYQVVAVAHFADFMRALMAEAAPTLSLPGDVDVAAYQAQLVERFGNPALPHRTWQIAMDGSQKLPQRLLATVRENLAAGRGVRSAALAVAGWMRYVTGVDEKGRPIDVRDPLAGRLRAIADAHPGDPAGLARALLAVGEVFGEDLAREPRFAGEVEKGLVALYRDGADAVVRTHVGLDRAGDRR